jgi:hypothetical protein
MAEEKVNAAKAEVQRLLDTCFIREVKYPQWLANIVMVRKKNGKWWMCIDFIDLNKWCPKDNFSLTRIDQIVDTAVGSETMAPLDYFWGTIRFGFVRKMKKRLVSSPRSGLIVTSKCPKVFIMPAQHSTEW